MSVSRREFLKFGATALAFGTFGGRRLFALPPGWKPGTRPRLVFGVMSDTHLRTHYDGVSFYSHYDTAMDDQAVVALLEYFKRQGADAVVHCGDLTDRGMTRTMELYKAAWNRVFKDGQRPVHLFATGNHDVEDGFDYWAKGIAHSEDPAVYNPLRLGPNLGPAMERIWGEPYEDVWHRVVKGCHFFGFGWGNDPDDWSQVYRGRLYRDSPMEGKRCSRFIHQGLWMTELVRREREAGRLDPSQPFFVAYHCNIDRYDRRNAIIHTHLAKALGVPPGKFCNGLGLFGHGHRSNADWFFFWDNKACIPSIECGSLAYWKDRGGGWTEFAKGFGDGTAEGRDNRTLALIVKVYDGFVALCSVWVEVKPKPIVAKLGPALVLPLEGFTPDRHPAQFDNLKQVVGRPEFGIGAELKVEWSRNEVKLAIPKADGNRKSRVYGYNVEVVGADGTAVRKNVFAKGYSYGEGYEPDGGVTEIAFSKAELPVAGGKKLTFRAYPCSAFAERGNPLEKTVSCIRVSLKNFAPEIDKVTRFAITDGAKIPDADRHRLVAADVPPWVMWVAVEDGEVVVCARPRARGE